MNAAAWPFDADIVRTAVAPAAAWIITYLIHSTVLLSLVFIAQRLASRLVSDRVREIAWRTALFGGLFTATAATCLPGHERSIAVEPPSITAVFTDSPSTAPISGDAGSSVETPAVAANHTRAADRDDVNTHLITAGVTDSGDRVVAVTEPEAKTISAARWSIAGAGSLVASILALIALVAGAAAIVRLFIAQRRLGAMLRGRREIDQTTLQSICAEFARRFGLRRRVRLSESDRVCVPMAFGILRPEVCLPARIAEAMDDAQVRAVMAHEIAHLARRDPLWRALGRLVASMFFFQPLNRLACGQMQEIAEFECDRLAVAHRASPTALARSLTVVAAWLLPPQRSERSALPPPEAMAASMARGVRRIRRRIERMLAEHPCAASHHTRPAADAPWRAAAVCAVGALTCAAILLPRAEAAQGVRQSTSQQSPSANTAPRRAAAPIDTDSDIDTDVDFDFDNDIDIDHALDLALRELRAEIILVEQEVEHLAARLARIDADRDTLALMAEIRRRLDALRLIEANIVDSIHNTHPLHDREMTP